MVQDCPRCNLVNPPGTELCECGYNFRAPPKGQIRKPSVFGFVFCMAFFLFALVVLGLILLAPPITPEEELVFAEGPATNVSITTIRGRWGSVSRYLQFVVGGYSMSLPIGGPKFDEVRLAAEHGTTLRVWVAPKEKGWSSDDVPIYKLQVGDHELINYPDAVNEREDSWQMAFGTSVILFLIALMSLGIWYRAYHRYKHLVRVPEPPQQRDVSG